MKSCKLNQSVYRIMSDLVKFDSSVSIDELNLLDNIVHSYGITNEDRLGAYSITLASAIAYISQQSQNIIQRIIHNIEDCSLRDGECSRDEAMLITAIEITCKGEGHILSLPLENRPILTSQILYVDPTYNPKKNELDKMYDEIKHIVEVAGFDLIYIPQVAESFKHSKSEEDLKRLLLLINPSLDESALVNKVMSLQDMDTRFFYIQVLNGRLHMNLNLSKPVWLIRLQNSTVNGIDHANYFCYHVNIENLSRQLSDYIRQLNSKMNSYSIIVNRHSQSSRDFPYDGFHKALLDVMATDRVAPWEIKVYVRAGSSLVVDNSDVGQKYSVSINREKKEYPILINGREAAFYLLLLCASAGPDKGINFEYDRERARMVQGQFDAAYKMLSNRDSHTPDITLSSTFRPIKAKVLKALKESGIKGDLHLFKPTKKDLNSYYIPLPSENIKVVSSEGEILLKDSTIFKTYLMMHKNKG